MPPAPGITVVLPVFNGAGLVGRAVRSVLAQSFPDWELVVVDDGSTDGTAGVLAGFTDPRVRVLTHPTNQSLSPARNTALAAARGEWVCYLDHDDEFYPDHLARVWGHRDRADVLVFRYDLVEERPGHPAAGTARTYDPAPHLPALHARHVVVPLGVAHRRALIDRVGGFDERLGRYMGEDEDSDLWRRFARAGASFLPVPASSGRYHVRADSLSRARPDPPSAGSTNNGPPRVLFVSYHCGEDPASGAAICTRDLFDLLAERGWRCGTVTGPRLDDRSGRPVRESLPARPGWVAARADGFTVHTHTAGAYPATVFDPDPPAPNRFPSPAEAAAFAAVVGELAARFRPDVVLTYGGDPASRAGAATARAAGAVEVFWLHNLAYRSADPLRDAALIVVPSDAARGHYRAALGVDSVALPGPFNPARFAAAPAGPGFVTLVNPEPAKGVSWFARLADVLGRTRPDVPLLVVEGRGKVDWLSRCGVDLAGVRSVHRMPTTPDPRAIYRWARVLLVPSVGAEPLGRVAVEAMLNGVPVVGSGRGGLGEVLAGTGLVVPIPDRFTPATREPPAAADVAPWADRIVRLWDDPDAYAAAAAAGRAAARRFHPDELLPRWEAVLAAVAGSAGSRH